MQLNCSFTVAKSLAKAISTGLDTLQKLAGRDIMTMDEIGKLAVEAKADKGSEND